MGFSGFYLSSVEESVFWLPLDQNVEPSDPPAPSLLGHIHVFHMDDNRQNLWKHKSAPIKMFSFIKVILVIVSLHSNGNPNKHTFQLLVKVIFFKLPLSCIFVTAMRKLTDSESKMKAFLLLSGLRGDSSQRLILPTTYSQLGVLG